MNIKRTVSLLVTLLMAVSLVSCKNDNPQNITPDASAEKTTQQIAEEIINNDILQSTVNSDTSTATVTSADTTDASDLSTTAVSVKNPSEMSEAEIIEAYKNAAVKSAMGVMSQHSVEITKIIINGEELGSGFDFVKKIISKFISNNTEDSKGITGGYTKLTENDAASAKAYSAGNNTAIEMVMKNQTDGAKSDIHSGSVGHAIDVVGDISVVTNELTELGLPIEISSESTSIHYTNPVVKVLIDGNGKIVKGTWSYTVEIRLNNYKVFGTNVESSSIIMNNVITVNGGF
ncbi:MAG: hypothetical protein IKK63_03825 [Clostridia bacterium]|nr:hypothetical protein [Clostridia bacterium]